MTFTVYRLTFPHGIHLGDHRPDDYGSSLDYLPSDSLHAALLAMQARMGRPVPGAEGPGYQLSSAFPFATVAGRVVYFFPKPLIKANLGNQAIDYAKKLKKARWLDADYLGRVLRAEYLDFGGERQPHLQGSYVSARHFPANFSLLHSQPRQRVTVPRYGSEDANPFISDVRFFAEGAGLFFLFQGNATAQATMEASLTLLSHEGLGTDRNIGNGHFTYTVDNLHIQAPMIGEYGTNLGLFCPVDQPQLQTMLDDPQTAYRTIRRGGWITTSGGLGRRKRSITMFEEGCILRTREAVAGRPAIDLSPPGYSHPVWRNGQTIFLPVKVEQT